MTKLRIGIDVDQTLADLHGPWIKWANAEFGTHHTEFTQWDDPTNWWGDLAYKFLKPRIYDEDIIVPFDGAKITVDTLREQGHDILFVTACNHNEKMERSKAEWLKRHGLLYHMDEFHPRVDKSNAPADVLADDGFHNVETFKGKGILVDASHNKHDNWPHRIPHINALPVYLKTHED